MTDRSVQRRLAAVLAADVAGYTRLMEQDTDGTVAAWQDARDDVIDPTVAVHSGRVVKLTGDGFLVEFPTVQDAVRCAIAMQEGLASSSLNFRMGVNLGDIVDDGEDIHGEGVNIAARIEALADVGGISISGGVYDQVRNRIEAVYEDRGEHEVKHVTAPVRVFAIRSNNATNVAVVDGRPIGEHSQSPSVHNPNDNSHGKAVEVANVTLVNSVVTNSHGDSNSSHRPRNLGIGAVVFTLCLAGGLVWWRYSPTDSIPLTSFPSQISTDEMRAEEIVRFVTGMTITGTRNLDGLPFTIVLNADRTANYQFPRKGDLSGTVERVLGKWYVEDFRFCIQLRQFARGRELCPRIEKNGLKITVRRRRDGSEFPWSLSK